MKPQVFDIEDWMWTWQPGTSVEARKPDEERRVGSLYKAVWRRNYFDGPEDVIHHATMVQLRRAGFRVYQYNHPWVYAPRSWSRQEHGDTYVVDANTFSPDLIRRVFQSAVRNNPKLRMPKDPLRTAVWMRHFFASYELQGERPSYIFSAEDPP